MQNNSLDLHCRRTHSGVMNTTFQCHTCHHQHSLSDRTIVSRHRTSEGDVVYVRCPIGHLTVSLITTSPAASPVPAPAANIEVEPVEDRPVHAAVCGLPAA